ncbi:MAG: AarF/UbiB family protein [Reichenbachiella sp.]|uniref:ABC1 kinase family protein n=1 Tax=Reichenbachiella sp. TaxID=2184521 RepID=UPI0032974AD1
MKTIDSIPVGKISRAGKLLSTGIKVGSNQLKYYGEKITDPKNAKRNLDVNNAEDIYNGLSQLKGSSLKVAQMLSMDKNILPEAYVDKFSLSQFSVPPLSGPLVQKTFKRYFGKTAEELYDKFESESTHAASIGQVHKAEKDGNALAVKIQYPGVAESISSDLALVKPFAKQLLNLKGKELEKYFKEVEGKLLEETDYLLEVDRSQLITQACRVIPNIKFPTYYKDLSNERVITMDWMTGVHMSEFTSTNTDQPLADQIGQTLWDFYMFQIHGLKEVHADPHPGNFLVDAEGNLIAIDFGCIKEIPDEFYVPYFELSNQAVMEDSTIFEQKLYELEILREDDSERERIFFKTFFKELLSLFTLPFNLKNFDFNNDEFFNAIAEKGQQLSKNPEFKKMNQNRGSKHFLYMNRTFFGLYNLLYSLKSKVEINHFKKYF